MTLEQGPQTNRTAPILCHLTPAATQQNTGSPRPAGRPSARRSAGRGWHPDLRPPPGELWNRRQEEWQGAPEPQCPEQKEGLGWLTSSTLPDQPRKNNAHKQNARIMCVHVLHTCKRTSIRRAERTSLCILGHPCALLVSEWGRKEASKNEWMNNPQGKKWRPADHATKKENSNLYAGIIYCEPDSE